MALSKSASSSGCDRTRFLRLALVIVDELTQILRDLLEREISHSLLYQQVSSNKKVFDRLSKQSDHLRLIQNACTDGYKDFDITLLYSLISNVCSKNMSPTNGWWKPKMPSQNETKLGDDIERIRLFKNKLYSHMPTARISETDFNGYWAVIKGVCQRIGNFLNKDYIQSLKEKEICPIDEELERKLLEKTEKMHERDNEVREHMTEVREHMTEMREQMTEINKSVKGIEVGLKVNAQAKDPAKKELAEALLKTTEKILNDMVDCINEVTSEEELTKVYESVEESLQNETYEKVQAFIGPFFEKLSSKISNYANTRVQKIGILNKYLKFVNKLKKRYGADIKAYHSSLLLKLTFSSEEGYGHYEKDLERGEIGREILDLLLFPEYIACFDLKADDMIISLNDKTIYGSGDKKYYEDCISGISDGSSATTCTGGLDESEIQEKVVKRLRVIFEKGGSTIRFNNLRLNLIREIPDEKLNSLKQTLKVISSMDVSVENVTEVIDFFAVLYDEGIFTEQNVIVMQYLLRSIERPDLELECVEYARNNKQCYFEEKKPAEDGNQLVQLHVARDIADFTSLESILETVAAIADCDKSCIKLVGVFPDTSFIIVISMKEEFARTLEQESPLGLTRLLKYNVDWIKVGNEIIDIARGNRKIFAMNSITGYESVMVKDCTW